MANIKEEKGFTLFEAVVAIGILLVGVIGLYMSVQNLKRNFEHTSKYVIAAYLNQESLEIIRNRRDAIASALIVAPTANWWDIHEDFSDQVYNTYRYFTVSAGANSMTLIPMGASPEKCFSDDTGDLKDCFNDNENIVPIKVNGGMYVSANSGDPTLFKRVIRLQKVKNWVDKSTPPDSGARVENQYDKLFVESITLFYHNNQIVRHRARMNLYGCYYVDSNLNYCP